MSLGYPSFWKNASIRRKRLYLFLLLLVLAIVVTIAGTFVPLSTSESQQIYDRINQTTTQGSIQLATSIFFNNFPLCLAMFIPMFGAVFGLFIMLNTGIALGAELRVESSSNFQATTQPISASTAVLALALIAVVFSIEYVSYSIGMSESLWLFRRLMQRKWPRELRNAGILIGICAILLTVGAIVETLTIKAGL